MSKQKTVFLFIGAVVIILGLVFWMGQKKKARLAAEKVVAAQPKAQPPKEAEEEIPEPQNPATDTSSQIAPLPVSPPAAEQSARITQKDRLTEGLGVAAGVRNAMTKYYRSHNGWPGSNVEMGLPPPEGYAVNTLQSVTVSPNGKVVLLFAPSRGTEAKLILQGAAGKAGDIAWACTSPDLRDIEQIIPYCTYSK